MKKICCLLLIMIIALNSLYPIILVATDETLVDIQFKDVNLYNAIVDELGSKISSKDDSSLTIKMTQEKIGTVESLDLGYNQISDISSLSGLTSLEDLYLSYNQIIDISSLGRFDEFKVFKFE